MVKIQAKQYLLTKYASFSEDVNLDYGSPNSNFTLITKEFDTENESLLQEGEVLIENLYLSNDPAQKGWFTPYKSYIPPSPLNVPAPARGIAKVLKSNATGFEENDIIGAQVGWATHAIIKTNAMTQKLDATKVPSLSKYLSVFGSTTITAYLAAFKYSTAKPDEEGKVWLVTGAAGAVGSALVQILDRMFKPKKIIAVAGGDEKCKLVKSLGSDKIVVVDYKSPTYDDDFAKVVGDDEINYFVDQVGGDILNKAMNYLAVFATIVQVGAISRYNTDEPFDFSNYSQVVTKRLTIKGMVIVDDIPQFGEIIGHLIKEITTGNLDISKFQETVVEAKGEDFVKVPEIWTGLFKGQNKGKFITKLTDL